jgi:tight adherence protein C
MLLFPVLVFLSVTFALASLLLWLMPGRAQRRLDAVGGGTGTNADWTATVARVAGPFARLAVPEGSWEDSPLRIRFLQAGLRHPQAHLAYFGLKGLLPVAAALTAFAVLPATGQALGAPQLFAIAACALLACYLPNMLLALRARRRQREIFENFPDAADLMLVCVEAGLGIDAALGRVTGEIVRKSPILAEELHLTSLEIRAGASREQALRNLALRTGVEEIRVFATMLVQADKFGTGIAASLRVFSDELRHKRSMRAEERAAKIPVKMLFPLVLFIFPSIIMVVLGPALVHVVRTILPMVNGR